MSARRAWRPPLLALLLLPALAGCGNLAYYAHLAQGQYAMMSARVPIADIVDDPQRDPVLRDRLRKVLDARAFAAQQLHLPDNRSYTLYADLQRPYVVWNVFAAPALSLKPVEHCFLMVGCLAYRGYFNPAEAQREAQRLRDAGDDVFVAGIPAYSTLGWFDDPVLNTMMHWSDEMLISTIFHELGHQQLYLKGDTVFNESFANFVGQEGLRQYLAARGGDDTADALRRAREHRFIGLLLAARKRLQALYDSDAPDSAKQAGKDAEFTRLRAEYQALRDGEWRDFPGYDRFFAGELNNARLLPFGLYDEFVPAFAALFRQQHGDWPAFYAAAKALSEQPDEARQRQLETLNAEADAAPSP
ncbi:MAG: aminopeptidase [Nevskiaceae bacterium]|nr:MAG: aminopeptidase [Nevskiaceae bacterium]